jgi:hypothetical protein
MWARLRGKGRDINQQDLMPDHRANLHHPSLLLVDNVANVRSHGTRASHRLAKLVQLAWGLARPVDALPAGIRLPSLTANRRCVHRAITGQNSIFWSVFDARRSRLRTALSARSFRLGAAILTLGPVLGTLLRV